MNLLDQFDLTKVKVAGATMPRIDERAGPRGSARLRSASVNRA